MVLFKRSRISCSVLVRERERESKIHVKVYGSQTYGGGVLLKKILSAESLNVKVGGNLQTCKNKFNLPLKRWISWTSFVSPSISSIFSETKLQKNEHDRSHGSHMIKAPSLLTCRQVFLLSFVPATWPIAAQSVVQGWPYKQLLLQTSGCPLHYQLEGVLEKNCNGYVRGGYCLESLLPPKFGGLSHGFNLHMCECIIACRIW